jgi:DNA polymerase-3 subunit epsilon
MNLNLKNPIIFFDLETTGTNIVTDRIVEISYLKIYPNGKEESNTFLVNPTIPIPEKSTTIHGIKDEDVKDAPTFNELAQTLANILEGSDLAGYNSNKFDIPLLAEELIRAGVDIDLKKRKFIDVQVIFHKKEQRTLSAAYKFYCKKDLSDAHSAEADTRATLEVLKAQLDRYPDLKNDVDELSKYSSHNRNLDYAGRIVIDDDGTERFNFGKYKGMSVEEVLTKDPAYYGWIMNSEFPLYTKKVLTGIKLRGAFANNKSIGGKK